ncbi:hypothetical protein DH2020_044255 [Rehmannia glutinosa]|uniref:Mitochondrial import inner membrane translocase subunit TIM50 n=1 Tax=Rehmannia glutinosa TaxID=99300 RepID=A0ABR0UHS5_REHGL
MAEKTTDSKLKVVVSDESSEDEKEPGNVDLGLSLDKLNLGPKKKLLVLCLGGLLVHRVHVRDKATVRGLKPDVVYGKFLVFKRPFCTEFLKFCFERFDVALWSSARDPTQLFFQSYQKHNKQDNFLGPDGELLKYLDGLVDAKDVPSYVKDHPFGQPAITETHPDWDYYAKIVRHFDKKKMKALKLLMLC